MAGRDRGVPHSSEYFGPQRDFWWNRDYLELLAARWELGQVESAVDVGAGVGHWGMVLASVLSPRASVVGVERDERSVEEARHRAQEAGLAGRTSYVQDVAEALPFEDETFDLATCQTLLIHVPDVRVVLEEMRRVTKVGGLVVAAEPNNSASLLVASGPESGESVEARLDRLRFVLTCERGKIALGEGDNSLGDLLPGHFADVGLTGIETYINDKASALVPPYATEEQEALRAALVEDREQGRWVWPRDDAERYFVAGGGNASGFDEIWARGLAELDARVAQLDQGVLHTAGGGIHYIVCGRRT